MLSNGTKGQEGTSSHLSATGFFGWLMEEGSPQVLNAAGSQRLKRCAFSLPPPPLLPPIHKDQIILH